MALRAVAVAATAAAPAAFHSTLLVARSSRPVQLQPALASPWRSGADSKTNRLRNSGQGLQGLGAAAAFALLPCVQSAMLAQSRGRSPPMSRSARGRQSDDRT
eukprot:6176722-Pleurochrysis_carterae.AAC.1